jgi:hypothetical protein
MLRRGMQIQIGVVVFRVPIMSKLGLSLTTLRMSDSGPISINQCARAVVLKLDEVLSTCLL